MNEATPRVVIIGAGFGGLYAAQTLQGKPVNVTIIDRHNFHTFTPLLYQVATCGLDPSGIAYPIRSIFRSSPNIRFLLGEVKAIQTESKEIIVGTTNDTISVPYDYLIVAAGSVTNTFQLPGLETYAFGLKSLGDAVVLRNHILKVFEEAVWSDDEDLKKALTTIVVVGGGPTGLETAGALYELYDYVFKQEFYQRRNGFSTRVILVEAMDHLLPPYPTELQQAALRQLESMGVEVFLGKQVDSVEGDSITFKDGDVIRARTLVWAAGVKASPIAEMLNVPLQRGGRVQVSNTLRVIDLDAVFAVGDMSYLEDELGSAYPMVIPVAKQQGMLAAKNILAVITGEKETSFRYIDRGIMATIGRSRAVAWLFYRIQLKGYIAWIAWLGLHLIWLMGFRNRIAVFVNWVWNYFTYDRSVRIILEPQPHHVDKLIDEITKSTS